MLIHSSACFSKLFECIFWFFGMILVYFILCVCKYSFAFLSFVLFFAVVFLALFTSKCEPIYIQSGYVCVCVQCTLYLSIQFRSIFTPYVNFQVFFVAFFSVTIFHQCFCNLCSCWKGMKGVGLNESKCQINKCVFLQALKMLLYFRTMDIYMVIAIMFILYCMIIQNTYTYLFNQ